MAQGPASHTRQRRVYCLAGQSLSYDRAVVCGTLNVTVPIAWLRISSIRPQLRFYLFLRCFYRPWSPVLAGIALADPPGSLELREPDFPRLPISQDRFAFAQSVQS